MNRPPLFTYAVGNPISVVAICCVAAALVYQWWTRDGSLLGPFLAFLASSTALNANGRIADYNRWKQRWNAMSGSAGAPSKEFSGWKWTAMLLGAAVWFAMIHWLREHHAERGTAEYQMLAGVFAVATLGLFGWFGVRIVRWRVRRREREASAKASEHVVEACLPVPQNAPTCSQCAAALPTYCRWVLQPASLSPGLPNVVPVPAAK